MIFVSAEKNEDSAIPTRIIFVVLIFPFFVQLILHVICTITNHIDYSSVYWVQPGHGIVAWWIPVVSMGIGIPVTFFVFMKKGAKEDVF